MCESQPGGCATLGQCHNMGPEIPSCIFSSSLKTQGIENMPHQEKRNLHTEEVRPVNYNLVKKIMNV